ncbi:MAG: T9SS type A sorting domain-containing protein [Bacteroidia bacterium]|nr:T9SS type A sorting domain-containing protein [Bacteroidia bacterium]
MKKTLCLFILFICILQFTKAQQNLVPNHSFEIKDTCPDNTYPDSPAHFAKDWFEIRNSPDYFTVCNNINPNYNVPNNSFGFQCPANGSSYLGLYTFVSPTLNGCVNELAAAKLNDSLVKNTKYYISYKVVSSNGITGFPMQYATSKQGMKLFTKKPTYVNGFSNDNYVNNFSQIYTSLVISDTLNWTTTKASFIADSNYKYVSIGSFFNYGGSDTTKVYSGNGIHSAYYYFDDICLSTDSLTCNINVQSQCVIYTALNDYNRKNSGEVSVHPNPSNGYFYIKGIKNNLKWELLDIESNIIRSGNISKDEHIKINDLPESVYVLQLYTEEGVLRKKIIVKH